MTQNTEVPACNRARIVDTFNSATPCLVDLDSQKSGSLPESHWLHESNRPITATSWLQGPEGTAAKLPAG